MGSVVALPDWTTAPIKFISDCTSLSQVDWKFANPHIPELLHNFTILEEKYKESSVCHCYLCAVYPVFVIPSDSLMAVQQPCPKSRTHSQLLRLYSGSSVVPHLFSLSRICAWCLKQFNFKVIKEAFLILCWNISYIFTCVKEKWQNFKYANEHEMDRG